ncbi:GLUG motif-containing protein, partial [Sedimentisphaera salicampi]|uniref:GLUG motif-containing protein n=1 Tax=Sedimentisphaera salicampi TaxID=1941349 RepID=UPI000E445A42
GGLCGKNSDGTITNCYATGSVSGGGRLGGLCGDNDRGTITNCYANGIVSGNSSLGGLCGYNYGGTIENCYATGSVSGGDGSYFLGGLCGENGGTIENCFWDKESSGMDTSDGGTGITTAGMQNPENFEDAGWIIADYNTGQRGWYIGQGRYPKFYWQHDEPNTEIMPDIYGMNLEEAEAAIVNAGFEFDQAVYVNSLTVPEGKVSTFSAIPDRYFYLNTSIKIYISTGIIGEGTAENPYYISSSSDLEAVNSDLDASYILECNIDLSGRTYERAVIAPDTDYTDSGETYDDPIFTGTPFTGSFDGADYKILNLKVDASGAVGSVLPGYLGLFGKIDGGEVRNLGIENALINGGDNSKYIGSLCGRNEGTIQNCYAAGSVSGGDDSEYHGGLCGYNRAGSIENCYATGSVSGGWDSNDLGGLCGDNDGGTIENCYATGDVSGGSYSEYLGGLCGYNDSGTIENC